MRAELGALTCALPVNMVSGAVLPVAVKARSPALPEARSVVSGPPLPGFTEKSALSAVLPRFCAQRGSSPVPAMVGGVGN